MSSENSTDTGIRRNFASRLLNRAIKDRQTGEIKQPEVTTADAEKSAATATEVKEPVATASS